MLRWRSRHNERWRAAAEVIAQDIPAGPVADRVSYLLGEVSTGGVSGKTRDMSRFFYQDRFNAQKNFLVINADKLDTSLLPEPAREELVDSKVEAGVHHHDDFTVMLIPGLRPRSPIYNSMVYYHELEHVTEREAGLWRSYGWVGMGMRERRAYGTNIDILRAADGSDFDRYVDQLPHEFGFEETGNETHTINYYVRRQDAMKIAPPGETMMRGFWDEGRNSKAFLCNVGMMATIDRLHDDWPAGLVDRLSGHLNYPPKTKK